MTTRANYDAGRQARLLPLDGVPDRPAPSPTRCSRVDLYDDRARGAGRASASTCDALAELEPDAALGNGGLGPARGLLPRLDGHARRAGHAATASATSTACSASASSTATQVETPDYWLARGNPWEFQRPEVNYRVRFGGRVQREGSNAPYGAADWVDTRRRARRGLRHRDPRLRAPRPRTRCACGPRAPPRRFDLSAVQSAATTCRAVEAKNQSENVSRVLYPDDSTPSGRELRLRQEYFFCQRPACRT